MGIRQINGDLVVTDNFAMNYTGAFASAKSLAAAMDAGTRSAAATRVWMAYLANSGKPNPGNPSVSITGSTFVQSVPSNLTYLFTHESAPMKSLLKAILCYSNNFLSERLGDLIGGPYAVARVVQNQAGVPPNEFSLQTSSGLGYNRVTPNAMMKLLRALRNDLTKYRMTFSDIMPVAGIDKGTLENRFDMDGFNTGSVVGKTGTLGVTDSGVSALAGEMNTRQGRLLFVIFNQRGSVPRFRAFQNSFVSLVQSQFGGPVPLEYSPMSLDVQLAQSRIVSQGTAY
jgi:D-alanyl-D-alanine carboxypeptidase/D-alanyl-D-alanine-endopeptidase (penicillin-binding protein 4)